MKIASICQNPKKLDKFLGDPFAADNFISFKNILKHDEKEIYPDKFLKTINAWGFSKFEIPKYLGGKLNSFEELLMLNRMLSRRDLSMAVAYTGSFLGALIVWMGGSEAQQKYISQKLMAGKKIAFALTEKNHGSDVLADDFIAKPTKSGYLLSGEKWLIGNASHADFIVVFVKTDSDKGARNYSFFILEKAKGKNKFTLLPKVRTYGLRAHDVSGIRLSNYLVNPDQMIGKQGSGLELCLKMFQISRTMCASYSLGSIDTALRITLDFIKQRQLYGKTAWDIPLVKSKVADVYLDILICECISLIACRAIHFIPEEMSVISAIIKYWVPTTINQAVANLSTVLGARYYLREEHCHGLFQKILRDAAVISLFDGSTAVNADVVAKQLQSLLFNNKPNQDDPQVMALFNLKEQLPKHDFSKLQLHSQGKNTLTSGLENSLTYAEKNNLDQDLLTALKSYANKYEKEHNLIKKILHKNLKSKGDEFINSPMMHELAVRYMQLTTAAVCVQFCVYNDAELISGKSKLSRLYVACLHRIFCGLDPNLKLQGEMPYSDFVIQIIEEKYKQKKLFSIFDFDLI